MNTSTTAAREQRVRRAVARDGRHVVKIRSGERDYWQYGPYMIVDDDTNGIVSSGLDLEQVERSVTQ